MAFEKKLLVFNEWLDTVEGRHSASSVYLSLSGTRPSKFELDKRLREEYERYKWRVNNVY